MTLNIVTSMASDWISCPGSPFQNGITSVTIPTSWTGIVSLGVQTSGVQDQFAIVQLMVGGQGEGGYIQVANTSDSATDFKWVIVQASESGSAQLAAGSEASVDVQTTASKKK